MHGGGTLALVESVDKRAVLVDDDATAVPAHRVHVSVRLGHGALVHLSEKGITG